MIMQLSSRQFATPIRYYDRRFGLGTSPDDPRDLALCCLPSGCSRRFEDPIDTLHPRSAVKVSCSDRRCELGSWMHGDCFQAWEEEVLAYLCSCGKARSWSDSQRHENIWTRKGYDLVYKACLCMCGHGYLRRNLQHAAIQEEFPQSRKSSKKEPEGLCIQTTDLRPYQRLHRSSLSSSGSSPPSSTGTPPLSSPGGWLNSPPRHVIEFFADAHQAAVGNIFAHRKDMSVFDSLPRNVWNAYNIRSEDEGPHGTDETRSFILTTLSIKGINCVNCVLCQASMTVYDKYPLIDGTFYLSPTGNDKTIPVMYKDRPRHLAAVCMFCMNGVKGALQCRTCQAHWNGSVLVIGSMYSYDIFAAAPCCPARLACNQCELEVVGGNGVCPQSYSEFSRSFVCPHCHTDDYHFVKPLAQIYTVVQPIHH